MPARDRGWTIKGRVTKPSFSPRRVAVSGGQRSRAVRTGYPIPRATQEVDRPWLHAPPGWFGPVTEWACMWYLTEHGIGPQRRKLREGREFAYQKGLKSPGLFLRKPFTRGDFVLFNLGRGPKGTVLDPITPFTHPDPWFDIRKRRILLLFGWRVIFLEAFMLARDPGFVIEAALRGADYSSRGQGWP